MVRRGDLKHLFHKLFSISNSERKIIGQVGSLTENGCEWNLDWTREMFEWEREQIIQLPEDINTIELQRDIKDNWQWKGEKGETYYVKSIRE